MGIPTLISTATPSNASSVDITSGIDSTYDEYMFVFTDIGPATDDTSFLFQVNAAGESGYNERIHSTNFKATHTEAASSALAHATADLLNNHTGNVTMAVNIGNGGDESVAGILHLFRPSDTTYVKHYYSTTSGYNKDSGAANYFVAGYINVTAAIDEITFKMSSGNLDGVVQMYGIA